MQQDILISLPLHLMYLVICPDFFFPCISSPSIFRDLLFMPWQWKLVWRTSHYSVGVRLLRTCVIRTSQQVSLWHRACWLETSNVRKNSVLHILWLTRLWMRVLPLCPSRSLCSLFLVIAASWFALPLSLSLSPHQRHTYTDWYTKAAVIWRRGERMKWTMND